MGTNKLGFKDGLKVGLGLIAAQIIAVVAGSAVLVGILYYLGSKN